MVHAYVLVTADVGAAADLVETVRDIDAVEEAHVVAGDWDLIAEIDAPEVYDVLSTVSEQIGRLDGVTNTKTYVSMED